MIDIRFKPKFVRQYKKLPASLREEVKEKIELFKNNPKESILKIHKLSGRLKGSLSFSVNYKYRIVFEWEDKKTAVLLMVGDHDVYKERNTKL